MDESIYDYIIIALWMLVTHIVDLTLSRNKNAKAYFSIIPIIIVTLYIYGALYAIYYPSTVLMVSKLFTSSVLSDNASNLNLANSNLFKVTYFIVIESISRFLLRYKFFHLKKWEGEQDYIGQTMDFVIVIIVVSTILGFTLILMSVLKDAISSFGPNPIYITNLF